MKPLRILSPDFQLLAEIDDYESFVLTRRWSKAGDFQIKINVNKNNTDKLQKDNIVVLGSDVQKTGIIRHRELSVDESGKGGESILIKGLALSSILGRRITLPPAGQAYDIITDSIENVIKHYVDINAANPIDANRKIQQLLVSESQNRWDNYYWQSRYKQLDQELEAISNDTGIGWNIYIDLQLKKWIFETYAGRNLTVSQLINQPVVFSIDYDNIKNQKYVDSDSNYKNYGYVGGKGEGELRTIVEVGAAVGINRQEVFIDARDTEADNLAIRGQQKLNEFMPIKTFEGEILNSDPFIYGQDWDLGDFVTIQNKKWDITMDAQVTEVREVYEQKGFDISVNFGNSQPTLISKIKQEFGQLQPEITR